MADRTLPGAVMLFNAFVTLPARHQAAGRERWKVEELHSSGGPQRDFQTNADVAPYLRRSNPCSEMNARALQALDQVQALSCISC